MRLIDANRALRKVEEIPRLADKNQAFYEGCRYMQKRVLRIFHTAKTIDAIEVVRCKDCKHYHDFDLYFDCNHNCGMDSVKPTDFCSYGERKDGVING